MATPMAACSPPQESLVAFSYTKKAATAQECDSVIGCYEVAQPLLGDLATCETNRYIGNTEDNTATCPPAADSINGTWVVSSLIDSSTTTGFPLAHSWFKDFCVYDWVPNEGTNAPHEADKLPSHNGQDRGEWLWRDCQVVAEQASPAMMADWPALEAASDAAMGAVTALPSNPVGATVVSLVDSAVNSTAPDPGFGVNLHGRTMGLIINKLTCPTSGPCLGGVESTLSMPLANGPNGTLVRDENNGGETGSFGDLAKAILVAFHRARDVAGRNRIIINLSQGWDPRYDSNYTGTGKGWDTQLTGGIHAVRAAIGYVTCGGAIVIAAAGNSGGGLESSIDTGMIYPAAWQEHSLPGPVECAEWGFTAHPSYASHPLVYAVGGLDHHDRPIANHRPGGRPILNAAGSHAIVTDGSSPSNIYSGTSVATAVVSAAASVMWSYLPLANGPDVMFEVYKGSVNLGTTPDVCSSFQQKASGECKKQRRISMCSTVQRICTLTGCTSSCSVRPAFQSAAPSLTPSQPTTHLWSAASVTSSTSVGGRCNARIWSSDLTKVVDPCPGSQFYRIREQWLVLAQPEDPVCPDCYFDPQGTLWLHLAEELPGELSHPVLTILHENSIKERFILDIDEDDLEEEAVIEITDLLVDLTTATQATIDMTVDDDYSVSDPVLLP